MKRILNVKKKIGTLSKSSTNPFFKSQYLDLHSLLEAVEPLLQDEGLILTQRIAKNCVTSAILDSETGGVILDSGIELPQITDPQKLGACITYFRRYTLTSLLAISETDDDGNSASKKSTKQELSTSGLEYLMSDASTKEDINVALKDRELTSATRILLESKLKEL